jgi:hypothetical protein
VLRTLSVISYFNSGKNFFIDTSGKWLPDEKGVYDPVLKCILWYFP